MGKIHIKAGDSVSLVTEEIQWSVVELEASQLYELVLERQVVQGRNPYTLQANALFRADENGKIQPAEVAPLRGSYSEADSMGLFWSMGKKDTEAIGPSLVHANKVDPHCYTLTLVQAGVKLDSVKLRRQWYPEQIKRLPVHDAGLIGTYFFEEGISKPTIMVVGGSEGGVYEYVAAALASEGFHTFAIGYFGVEGKPDRLEGIDLSIVDQAVKWIKQRSETTEKIGIHGTSRGGEFALWSSVYVDDLAACVALNGMRYSMAGIVPWSSDKRLPPAWVYNGQTLPYLTPENPVEAALLCKQLFSEGKNPFKIWYDALYEYLHTYPQAKIPIERTNKPTLLLAGRDDGMFSAEQMNDVEHNPHIHQQLFAEAGHEMGIPYLPIFATVFHGGRRRETARASIVSWKRTVQFFQRHLKNEP
ncbi:acyl-CoA thioesterase/bile acid-CoA:amino acid N-acyltransferase family protein [Shouchella sp. 1P09AA]|uniref:acyl-CoA thioesterase/bile acid-CoA:amino acid N-acyltransferase family protein n=1 Tax=unclassified Shouchella TaxID=2893065 RepID=UPI0039A1A509